MATNKETAPKKPQKTKVAGSGKAGRFFREARSEFKKIVWPTPKTVWKNMGITLLVIAIIGAFVALLDFGLTNLLGLVMEVGRGASDVSSGVSSIDPTAFM